MWVKFPLLIELIDTRVGRFRGDLIGSTRFYHVDFHQWRFGKIDNPAEARLLETRKPHDSIAEVDAMLSV